MSRQLSQSEATLALRVVVRLLRRGKTLEGMIAAAGNSNDSSNIASVLRGLKELLQTECSTCEMLHEVKSQVDIVKKAQQKQQTAKMSRSASYRVRTAPADYCLEVFKF
eukprot:18090-Heterococcus_DN1.PRE.5